MAQETAAYEGLQYSSQGQTFDFGKIATGVADIVEKKRLEDERKAKELEQSKVEMIKTFGEDIYSAYDFTGFENWDKITQQVASLNQRSFEDINKRIGQGGPMGLTQSQAMSMGMNIKFETKKIKATNDKMGTFAAEMVKKGSNKSASDVLVLDFVNSMYKDGVAVGSAADGRQVLISKKDGKVVSTPFSSVEKLLTFSDNVKPDVVLDAIMKKAKENTWEDGNSVWTSVLTKDDKVTENQKGAIKGFLTSQPDATIYDLSQSLGIDVDDVSVVDGEVNILDRKGLSAKVQDALESLAKDSYGRTTNELDALNVKISREDQAIKRERLELAKQKSTPTETPFTQTDRERIYTPDVKKQGRGIQSINLAGEVYSDVIVLSYSQPNDGSAPSAKISYKSSALNPATKRTEATNAEKTVVITTPMQIATIENVTGLPGRYIVSPETTSNEGGFGTVSEAILSIPNF